MTLSTWVLAAAAAAIGAVAAAGVYAEIHRVPDQP